MCIARCNNFYASCERVFNPRLIGKPVVVLSNNDGCVIARSEEAKLLGIEMGAPAFKNEENFRRNGVHVLSSNYALYGDMSARVMATLRPSAISMEVYSIDDAFLGLDPSQGEPYCRELRAKVRQWTGIPVSVGIATTKTLAKLANRIAKKTPSLKGVFDLTASLDPDAVLARVPCGDVWGIGKRLAERLTVVGIRTALDLKQADMALVRRELGVVCERTARELGGVSCLTLDEAPDPCGAGPAGSDSALGNCRPPRGFLSRASRQSFDAADAGKAAGYSPGIGEPHHAGSAATSRCGNGVIPE